MKIRQMMPLKINLINETKNRLPRQLLTTVLQKAYCAHRKTPAVINILVAGDKKTEMINRKFLQHHYTTDVITFADGVTQIRGRILLGDIIVNIAMAERLAKKNRGKTADELTLYALHGLLHCLGYDDQTLKSRQKMFAEQQRWLKSCGARVELSAV